MTKEIRKELNQATRLYKAGKRQEAYEIYNRHFNENPDELRHWDRIRYCWCIYYMHIKDSYDERELIENAELVTDIIKQEDLNTSPVCVYTRCVFRLLKFYKKSGDWDIVLYWLDKLDPELLSETQDKSGDMIFPSNKEEYYSLKSKALLECDEFKGCIQISYKALTSFADFANNGDVWHKFRIAKALRELDEPQKAITFLEDVANDFDYWYVFKEFAEDYYMLDDMDLALEYAVKAILADGPVNMKVNLYLLVFNICRQTDADLALLHAKLFLAIKLETGTEIPDYIADLEIDEDDLDVAALECEIKDYWKNIKRTRPEPDFYDGDDYYSVEAIDVNAREDGYYAPEGGYNEPFDNLDGDGYYY